MGLERLPEVKMAQRILSKHSLSIPFDIEDLIKRYATLSYRDIPVQGVDGVSVHLKTPGKKPHIIVCSKISLSRRFFTLAHELGHVIIPWHVGTIVDDLHNDFYKDIQYRLIEQEANRFAAELLMPQSWVLEKFYSVKNLSALHELIVQTIRVSPQAAAIRVIQLLPPNIVYVAEEDSVVIHSASTELTKVRLQKEGYLFDSRFYTLVDQYSSVKLGVTTYHWWIVTSQFEINANDSRSWREILDGICEDISLGEQEKSFKATLNGIMGSANSSLKLRKDILEYTPQAVAAAIIHRLDRTEYKSFTSHKNFHVFLKKRIDDYFGI